MEVNEGRWGLDHNRLSVWIAKFVPLNCEATRDVVDGVGRNLLCANLDVDSSEAKNSYAICDCGVLNIPGVKMIEIRG